MKKTITKEFHFDSSHRLVDKKLNDEENKVVFGKCFNAPSHGHRYNLFVTVSGEEKHGMIINFNELKSLVDHQVVNVFDHHFINDLDCMKNMITTCEVMIEVIWYLISDELESFTNKRVRLEKLKLYETPTSYCELVREEM